MAKYIIQIPANYRARVGGNSQVTIDASSPMEARKQVVQAGIPAAVLGKPVEITGTITSGRLPTDVSQYALPSFGPDRNPVLRDDRVIGANNPVKPSGGTGRRATTDGYGGVNNLGYYQTLSGDEQWQDYGGEEVSGNPFAPNINPQPTMAEIQAATPFTPGEVGDPFLQPQGYQRMTADDFTKIRNFANQPRFDEAAFFSAMTGGSGSDVTTTEFDPRLGGAYQNLPKIPVNQFDSSTDAAGGFIPGFVPDVDQDAVNRAVTYGEQGWEGEDVSEFEQKWQADQDAMAEQKTAVDDQRRKGDIRPWAERVADIRVQGKPGSEEGFRVVVPVDMWRFDPQNPIGQPQMEQVMRHIAASEGRDNYNAAINNFLGQAKTHFDARPNLDYGGGIDKFFRPINPHVSASLRDGSIQGKDWFRETQKDVLRDVIGKREADVRSQVEDQITGFDDTGKDEVDDVVDGEIDGVVNGEIDGDVNDGVGDGSTDGAGGFGPGEGGSYNPEDFEEIVPEIEEIIPPPPQPFDMGAYTPFEDPTAIQEMLNTFNRDPERYYTTETVLGPDGELITQQVLSPVAQAALQAFSTQRGAEAMEQAARFGTSTPFGAIAGLGGTAQDAIGLAEQQAYSGITSPFAALQAGAGIGDISQILRGGMSFDEQRQLAGLQARGGLNPYEQRQLAGLQARGGLTPYEQRQLAGLQARGGLTSQEQYDLAGLQARGGLSVEDQYALAGMQARGGLSVEEQLALAGVQGRGGLTPQERLAEQRMALMPSLFQISPESLGGLSQVLGEQDLKNYLTPFFAQGGAAPSGTTPVSQGTHVPISSPAFAPSATGATTPAARGTVGGYMKATPFQKGGFQAQAAMAGQELPQFLGEVTPFGVSSGKGTLAASTF